MNDPKSTSRAQWKIVPHTAAGFFRLLIDASILAATITVATFLRLLWMISQEGLDPSYAIMRSTTSLLANLLVIVPITIAVFASLGFYTYGRFYENRYKVLSVIRGVLLALLICLAIALMVRESFGFSRSVLLLSFAMAAPVLALVRFGSRLWLNAVRDEQRLRHRRTPAAHRTQQRVLVIGGAGYIGSALIPKLLAEGHQVRVLDRMIYGQDAIAPFLDHPKVEIVRADFRQVDAVVKALQDVDSIVHLGAIVGDPACALNEQVTIDINLVATRMIAEVAKGLGIERFVFASTCSVYGASDELLNENSELNPVSLYARTKIACERVLLKMQDDSFRPCILRFSTIYGLSGRTRFDLVVNLLTAKAMFDGEITVSGGDQWRPFVHVDDAATSVLKAIEAPLEIVGGQIYNVGGNAENYTIDEAARLIQEQVPTAQIKQIPFDGDRRNYRVGFDKAERDLLFRPTWTLKRGITQVADAIRSGRIKSYRDPQYSNVTFLKAGVVATLEPENPLKDDLSG